MPCTPVKNTAVTPSIRVRYRDGCMVARCAHSASKSSSVAPSTSAARAATSSSDSGGGGGAKPGGLVGGSIDSPRGKNVCQSFDRAKKTRGGEAPLAELLGQRVRRGGH